MKAENYIPFKLHVLTPAHIGSGDLFTPLSYIIREYEQGKFQLCIIDGEAWLSSHATEPKTAQALNSGDMGALRSLLNGAPDISSFILSKINISTSQLGKTLFINRNNYDKNAEVLPFIRNPFTRLPYIPASSIKGAISTALISYLNILRKKRGEPLLCAGDPKTQKLALEETLGKIGRHAMRALRLGDMPLLPEQTSIRSAKGVDLEPHSSMDKTACETLDPTPNEQSAIYGLLRLFSLQGKACIQVPREGELNAKQLWLICRAFYQKRFLAEYEKFYKLPHFSKTANALSAVLKRVQNLAEDEMLLRIGRYSHIECVSITGIPQKCIIKNGQKLYGQSRTLADDILPFGWIILKRCSLGEYEKNQQILDETFNHYTRQIFALKEAETQRLAANQSKLFAEARKRKEAEEAAQKQREEAELKARQDAQAAQERAEKMAAMSPEERALAELRQSNGDDTKANEILAKLEEFGDLRLEAAKALKEYYERNGKWSGKKLSPKQKEKVKKLREILGE